MKVVSQCALLAIVAGSVLAFGAVEPSAYTVMLVALGTLWLAAIWHDAYRGQFTVIPPQWPLVFIGLGILQITPLPEAFVNSLSTTGISVSRQLSGVDL